MTETDNENVDRRGDPPEAEGRDAGEPRGAEERSASRREPPAIVHRLRRRREAYRERSVPYRIAWVTASLFVIAAGIVMIIFPGPALVVIPIGLAMLSLEFAWAERLLERTLERGLDAKDLALNASRRQKVAGVAAVLCAVAAVATAALIVVT